MGDHDTLFKRAFSVPENAAGEIRAVLPAAVVAQMELGELELLSASFVDAEMEHRHADLVFRVPLAGQPAYVYLLFEHQSEPDALMPYRVLAYIQRIWASVLRDEPTRKTLPIVVPVIVHHGRAGWTAPRRLHELVEGLDALPELAGLVPDLELLIDDLVRVDDEGLLGRPLEAFPKVALWVLRDARTGEALFESLRAWGEQLERLMSEDGDLEDVQTILRYILRVTGDVSFQTVREKFIEVAPAIEAAMASPAEQLIQQGLEEGLEKGLKQGLEKGREQGLEQGREQGLETGREQGKRQTLARLLELRFGALDAGVRARIDAARSDELDRWLDRVVTAETLDAVLAD